MRDRPRSYVFGPGEGRAVDLDDFEMTVKATAESTGGVVSVLEGEYVMTIEDEEHVCPAGSFVFIAQGARHGFRVGERPSRKLNFYFPASMIGYFDDLATALRQENVTDEDLAGIAAAHAMEIVGPPSERYV